MLTLVGAVGAASIGAAALAADVDSGTYDDGDSSITFLAVPRSTSSGTICWAVRDCDPWLEIQEYAMGGVGKLVRKMQSPTKAEEVKDFRLLLKRRLSDDCLELAVSPARRPLQQVQLVLRRLAQMMELGTEIDPDSEPGIPPQTVQAVISEARHRATGGKGSTSTQAQGLLRYDIQLHIFSYLCQQDLAIGPEPQQHESERSSFANAMPLAAELTRCATVCPYFAAVSAHELLWRPLLTQLNRDLKVVDDRLFDRVFSSVEMLDVLSSRDLFLLTCIEAQDIETNAGSYVARGLYGLRDEVLTAAASGAGCVVTGATVGSAVVGYPFACIGGCLGGASVAAVGGAVGAVRGRPVAGCMGGGYFGGLAGAGLGFYAGGAVGAVGGGTLGAAAAGFRMGEGVMQGAANVAGNGAVALRLAPDLICGPIDSTWHAPNTSGAHDHHRGITWGAILGVQAFGRDCATACSSLVQEPLRGAQKHQALGALKGLGRALVCLVTRPAAGTLDVAGGVMRGAGNRLGHIRECRIHREIADEVSAAIEACAPNVTEIEACTPAVAMSCNPLKHCRSRVAL